MKTEREKSGEVKGHTTWHMVNGQYTLAAVRMTPTGPGHKLCPQ